MRSVAAIAMAMGFLLSPDSLTMLGNSMGMAGAPFLIVMLTSMVLHMFTALSFGEMFSMSPGPGVEGRFLKEAMGSFPAILLPLCSRVMVTICAATGILATAGYIFNEVFVYWFPNLGFSFALLGFLLFINLVGPRVSRAAQISFVVMTLMGLLLLSFLGFLGLEQPPSVPDVSNHHPSGISRVLSLGLVLFVGFDLGWFAGENGGHHPSQALKPAILAIFVAGTVFILWGVVSAAHVSFQKLAETSVPHLLAAKKVLGQEGRILMGGIVLAGSSAAVNALLMAVSRMITGMGDQGLLPPFPGLTRHRSTVPLILLALGVGAMMASGMAGEEALEVMTRVGIWFWLLHYASVNLSVLIMRRRFSPGSALFQSLRPALPAFIGLSSLLAGLFGLLWTDPEKIFFFKFSALLLAILSGLTLLWIGLGKKEEGVGCSF